MHRRLEGAVPERTEPLCELLRVRQSNGGWQITLRLHGRVGITTPEVLQLIYDRLDHDDDFVRASAVRAIAMLNPGQFSDTLLRMFLYDRSLRVRSSVVVAAADVEGEAALPILLAAVIDENADLRSYAPLMEC